MSTAGGFGALLKPVRDFDPVMLALAETMVRPGNVVWCLTSAPVGHVDLISQERVSGSS
jgi:hypothetical protein